MKKFKDLKIGDLVYIIYNKTDPIQINVNQIDYIYTEFYNFPIHTRRILGTACLEQYLWLYGDERNLSVFKSDYYIAFCNEEEMLNHYENIQRAGNRRYCIL